ncbi:hypothetical protein [Saccharothrix sp. Mg75]|uniref:hypothetical protein n=1 Tax=Saccharothrix sp. Mg75 TaxID=3445357 RepID=UPI003EEEE257
MNEQELTRAMRDVVAASSPPPPMDARAALAAARRADRRRRTTWGAGVAGLAVVGIAVGAVVVPSLAGGGPGPVEAARSSSGAPAVTTTTTMTTTTTTTGTGVPPTGSTERPWPDGQTDRTATSGPRAAKGSGLLNALAGALPVGSIAQERGGAAPRTQAQFLDHAGDLQVWEYLVDAPVSGQGGGAGVGRVLVRVETRGNTGVRELSGCGLAISGPYPVEGTGRCDLVRVDGVEVPVVTAQGADVDFEQTAIHRHADGTLVVVGQSRRHPVAAGPALAGPPLTPQQLAGVAVDPAFHLD